MKKQGVPTFLIVIIILFSLATISIVMYAYITSTFLKEKTGGNTDFNSLINYTGSEKVGDYITFGRYEQDGKILNGKEKIEWLILEKDGNNLLLISRYALDCRQYNDIDESVTWETSSLREWLNGRFLNDAFNTEERTKIKNTTVTADINPSYKTSQGNNTTDKVFLLSITETKKYFNSDATRQCTPTAYCINRGIFKADNNKCYWWLRSSGSKSDFAAFVYNNGYLNSNGSVVDYNAGVRPVIWVDFGDSDF